MELWNISEAKANLSALIERVAKGEEILIGKAGRPVAKVSRYEPARANKRLGYFEGQIQVAPDFDDWPDDIAEKLGIKES